MSATVKSETRFPVSIIQLRRLMRLPLVPILIIGVLIVAAAFAPLLTTRLPNDMSLPDRRTPPVWMEGGKSEYPLGADALGRDILTRIVYSARTTAIVAGAALLLAGAGGLALGILAGYLGGTVDGLIMRVVDASMAFPTILLALVLAVTLGPGIMTVVIALVVVNWAGYTRVIRGEVLSVRNRDHVTSAVSIGCSQRRIMVVHILPMVFNTFMVVLSVNAGALILTEATLSFLGAGVPIDTPTWGGMVADGRRYIATAWWISAFPGLAITMVVLSVNLFGDWVRDRLDPRLRGL
ncbi:MAG: ABC transporter permease [Chloroflexota bacterium]|nr:ABC transporter permease [Chloroflexota bacterium]